MGGTGTVALKSSPVLDTAMSFLEYSKLSVEAQEAVWTILGTIHLLDVWDSEVTRQETSLLNILNRIFCRPSRGKG